jgi:hypothetical protein
MKSTSYDSVLGTLLEILKVKVLTFLKLKIATFPQISFKNQHLHLKDAKP